MSRLFLIVLAPAFLITVLDLAILIFQSTMHNQN
jgi:hypothetical protein